MNFLRVVFLARRGTGVFLSSVLLLGAMSCGFFKPAIDPKADALLKKMAAAILSANEMQLTIYWVEFWEPRSRGRNHESLSIFNVSIQRPNRFSIEFVDGEPQFIISDGINMYTQSSLNFYVEEAAPETLTEFSPVYKEIRMRRASLLDDAKGFMPFVDFLMSGDPYQALAEALLSLRYIGEDTLDGVPAHRLEFEYEPIRFHLWLQNGDRTLPLKIETELVRKSIPVIPAMPGPQQNMIEVNAGLLVTFANWNLEPAFTDEAFTYSPPANARKENSYREGIHASFES